MPNPLYLKNFPTSESRPLKPPNRAILPAPNPQPPHPTQSSPSYHLAPVSLKQPFLSFPGPPRSCGTSHCFVTFSSMGFWPSRFWDYGIWAAHRIHAIRPPLQRLAHLISHPQPPPSLFPFPKSHIPSLSPHSPPPPSHLSLIPRPPPPALTGLVR